MSTQSSEYTRTEAYQVVRAILADRTLAQYDLRQLLRRLVETCMDRPAAFKALCAARGAGAIPARDLRAWYAKAARGCQGLDEFAEFRSWACRSRELEAVLGPHCSAEQLDPSPSAPPATLSRSQRTAWDRMAALAGLYFSGRLKDCAIQPRTSVLLAGPSGVGKSHLVRTFAAHIGCAYLRLTYGGWIVSGGRGDKPTMQSIREFVVRNKRCLIHIDELDKIGALAERSDWYTCFLNEAYSVLDRGGFGEESPIAKQASLRLQNNTFIVGSGTWQDLWSIAGGERVGIGFGGGAATPPPDMGDKIRSSQRIPTELLNRFDGEVQLLQPLGREDFAGVLEAAGLTALAAKAGMPIDLEAAVRSGLGMRWVESFLTRLHLALAETSPETTAPAQSAANSPSI